MGWIHRSASAMPPSPPAPSKLIPRKVGFLDLPAELRNEIYELATVEDDAYWPIKTKSTKACFFHTSTGFKKLRSTCKQVRDEVQAVFFEKSKFRANLREIINGQAHTKHSKSFKKKCKCEIALSLIQHLDVVYVFPGAASYVCSIKTIISDGVKKRTVKAWEEWATDFWVTPMDSLVEASRVLVQHIVSTGMASTSDGAITYSLLKKISKALRCLHEAAHCGQWAEYWRCFMEYGGESVLYPDLAKPSGSL